MIIAQEGLIVFTPSGWGVGKSNLLPEPMIVARFPVSQIIARGQ